jgi:glycosyltransferase involved in cell wall biosynthesis
MELSVICTTYNSPLWLQKVLWGYQCQEFKDFEMIIADDGSTAETGDMIKEIQKEAGFQIRHLWQDDRGFRKCEILNKAIDASTGNYLLFSDGDCIPRSDFTRVHFQRKKEGYFLSGGYFKLPMTISERISRDDIFSARCFDIRWLKEHGLSTSFKNSKLSLRGSGSDFMNRVTPTNASWNGHNSSGWKKDILAVNGFDERMRYGSEDREFGERLFHHGIRSRQVRYSAVCLHLDHSRGYVNQTDLDNNALIRKETREQRKTWTPFGIKKGAP